jgi:hypothetical protein
MNGLRSLVTRFWMVSLGLAVLGGLVGAQQALAAAHGVEFVPAFKLTGTLEGRGAGVSMPISIPAGQLSHTIKGSGRKIEGQQAIYSVVPGIGALKGKICNWRIDFVYKQDGKEYLRERGKTVRECDGFTGPVMEKAKPKTVRYGKACAELWVDGKKKATQCHNIVKPAFGGLFS